MLRVHLLPVLMNHLHIMTNKRQTASLRWQRLVHQSYEDCTEIVQIVVDRLCTSTRPIYSPLHRDTVHLKTLRYEDVTGVKRDIEARCCPRHLKK